MSKQAKNKRPKPRRRRPPAMVEATTPLTSRMMYQLNEIADLIEAGDLGEAEQRLLRLDLKGTYTDVVDMLVSLYQAMGDNEKMALAAERLMKIVPHEPDPIIYFAQASLFCGRACLAQLAYQDFVKNFPDHEYIGKARTALEILEPETQQRIERAGLAGDDAMRLFATHETSVMYLGNHQFERCAEVCQRLCEAAPNFVSPRNNLALASLHLGKLREAIEIAEQTRARFADNGFVAASLIKLYFLAARNEEANAIGDELVAAPPTKHTDAYVATLESLALLGRDRDIIEVSKHKSEVELLDPPLIALASHYLAYAHSRLDEHAEARKHWQAAVKAMPEFPEANANLNPTDEQREHVPWADTLQKWLPMKLLEKHVRERNVFNPAMLANIIAALLDRGDPNGRQIGLDLAAFDITPAIEDALRAFAFGKRGPADLRMRALRVLSEAGLIGGGPHSIFIDGKFTEIELLMTEIHSDADPHPNSRFNEVMVQGKVAMDNRDFDLAEKWFLQAVDLEPDSPKGHYNLAAVWMLHHGPAGNRKGREKIEWIHKQFPEYAFAAIGMAVFEAQDGNSEAAMRMLDPFFKMPRLHISEAKALYVSRIQILMDAKDFDSARKSMEMLKQISDNEDPLIADLQQKLDWQSRKKTPRRP